MKNTVFIFGAGASKDFGMPLGIEIFAYAERLSLLSTGLPDGHELGRTLREVEKHFKYVFPGLPVNKAKYPPFEEVLTLLWECKKSERFDYERQKLISLFRSKYGAKDLFQLLVNLLTLTLVTSMQSGHKASRSLIFTEFIGHLLQGQGRVSFVSLNYDTLLDEALSECVKKGVIANFSYGVPLYEITAPFDRLNPFKNPVVRETGPLLLKPHGSLNLAWCPHHQARYGDGFYHSHDGRLSQKCDRTRCPGCGDLLKPLIIPPLYNKHDFINANAVKHPAVNARATPESYRRRIDPKIRDALRLADEIVVIGYSMPAYDFDFKTLLITSLMRNKKRRQLKLKIITKGDKNQLRSLKAQFKPFAESVIVAGSDGFHNYMQQRFK